MWLRDHPQVDAFIRLPVAGWIFDDAHRRAYVQSDVTCLKSPFAGENLKFYCFDIFQIKYSLAFFFSKDFPIMKKRKKKINNYLEKEFQMCIGSVKWTSSSRGIKWIDAALGIAQLTAPGEHKIAVTEGEQTLDDSV